MNKPKNANIILTKNAIQEISKLEINNDIDQFTVDVYLQVISIARNRTRTNEDNVQIFTATLSDGDLKCRSFVIKLEFSCPKIDPGDILHIYLIKLAMMETTKIFFLKNYDLAAKQIYIIGDPVEINSIKNYKKPVIPKYIPQNNLQNFNSTSNMNTFGGESEVAIIDDDNINILPNYNSNKNDTENPEENKDEVILDAALNGYMSLRTLTTFTRNLKILVLCQKKSEKKLFQSTTGVKGIVFNFIVIDAEGTEMPGTCFNEFCEKFFPIMEEQKVYEILGGYLKINDRKYGCLKSEYKLIADKNTVINEIPDNGCITPKNFNPEQIFKIKDYPLNTIVDLVAYVIEIREKTMKKTPFGENAMRQIYIGDSSGYKTGMALWKKFADLELKPGDIISIKSSKVVEFNGRNLTSKDDSVIFLNPLTKEADELRNWIEINLETTEWKTLPKSSELINSPFSYNNNLISYIKNILQPLYAKKTEEEKLLPQSKIKATVCSVTHSEKNYYPKCPETKCKKMVKFEEEKWFCNSCQKVADKPIYTYTFKIRIKDASGEQWVDIYGDHGITLFQTSCEDYKNLIEFKDENKLGEITNWLEFRTFYFVVQPRIKIYNNQKQNKLCVYKVENIDQSIETKRIISNISNCLNFIQKI